MTPTGTDRAIATACPLCGRGNACAMETERATGRTQPPCWCTKVDFSRELLERVPAAWQNRACICAACAEPPGR